MKSGDATPDIVEDAVNELWTATVAQRYKANKDNLKELIDKANGMDLSKYTKESANALKKALKAANAVMADDSLSVDEQVKVDEVEKDLKAAIEGLKLALNDGTGSDKDDDKVNGTPDTSGTDRDNRKDAPKTGDTMNTETWMFAMAGAAVVLEKRIKRKKQ